MVNETKIQMLRSRIGMDFPMPKQHDEIQGIPNICLAPGQPIDQYIVKGSGLGIPQELPECGVGILNAVCANMIHITSNKFPVAQSELLALHTSASGSYTQPVDDSGNLIYDANNIRVVCKGLKQDVIWDGSIVFYMENNSTQPVTVYAENVSINGYMVDVSLWADLRAATKIIDGMLILDLEAVDLDNIDGVEEIEFTLRIINSDNWNEIATTDVIKLEFNN